MDSLLQLLLFLGDGIVWFKVTQRGEAVIYVLGSREVTHLAKTTQPSTGVMSTKNHKENSEGDQNRTSSKLLFLPLTLSCAHKHTQTQGEKKPPGQSSFADVCSSVPLCPARNVCIGTEH